MMKVAKEWLEELSQHFHISKMVESHNSHASLTHVEKWKNECTYVQMKQNNWSRDPATALQEVQWKELKELSALTCDEARMVCIPSQNQ